MKPPRRFTVAWAAARARRNWLTVLGLLMVAVSLPMVVLGSLAVAPSRPAATVAAGPRTVSLTAVLGQLRTAAVTAAVLDDQAHTLTLSLTGRPAITALIPASYTADVVTTALHRGIDLTVRSGPATTGASATSAATDRSWAGNGAVGIVPGATTASTAATRAADGANGWQVAGILLLIAGAAIALGGVLRAAGQGRAGGNATPAAPTAAPRAGRLVRRPGSARHAQVVTLAERPTTRFADVAGAQEAVFDLSEIVMFLKDPARFTRAGAEQPKGALLVGPPGTGKTLLARAVAGEANVPFFAVSGSDFTEMYVGVGAARVRALFAAARAHEKAIIFIDEIDAIAAARSGAGQNGNSETESTLNALLVALDGFTASNVVLLAATNRKDKLDPAILRPGRLDRMVEVPNPDRRGREQILAVHARNKPIEESVDLTAIAMRTPGFSGAQLKAVVNEACLMAVRTDSELVTEDFFHQAVATIAMGRARTSALVTEHDARITAWHEGGHALAGFLQPDADNPVAVSIVPRGPAGGVTWFSGNDDIFISRRAAHAQLVTALAGRVGEELLMGGEYTQGASGDLQSATALARRMATEYGMTRLGFGVRERSDGGGSAVTDVVEELLSEAHATATALLSEHRELLSRLAAELLVRKDLSLADLEELAEECGVARHSTSLPVPSLPRRRPPYVDLDPAPVAAADARAVRRPRRVPLVAASTVWRGRIGRRPAPAPATY